VKVEPTVIGGVKAYVVTPESIPETNRNRLLVHVHGGGYVFGPGEAGTREAILMAGYSGMKVISVDYRMPPDFPYPAALDDAMTVWNEVVKTTNPKNIAIFGTSTGGGMTLAMVLRAQKEGLPLPAATAPGTPWSDMTKTGDTYFSNEMVDNVLVSNDGWLGDAAKLYANGHDLKDPMLSPVYGDFQGFPPTILTSGTRDLFLSNTVRVHRKMRAAGVDAELEVFEGQSHAVSGRPLCTRDQGVFRRGDAIPGKAPREIKCESTTRPFLISDGASSGWACRASHPKAGNVALSALLNG
jgi:acetyl esterase/lipase